MIGDILDFYTARFGMYTLIGQWKIWIIMKFIFLGLFHLNRYYLLVSY